jgi:hypothetical protein
VRRPPTPCRVCFRPCVLSLILSLLAKINSSKTSRVGFEPTRAVPNGFQVHRLNLSANVTSIIIYGDIFGFYSCVCVTLSHTRIVSLLR